MRFNPDPKKQANEVVFSRNITSNDSDTLTFNNSPVAIVESQKLLGLILDETLYFKCHIEEKITKTNKSVGPLKNMASYVQRKTLLTADIHIHVYKWYVSPHLDYADVVYDQPNNQSLWDRIESAQYNTCLAITGAIRGTRRERLYNELGLES